ncbi:MAG TPA: hypothetical protein VH680_15035 [Gemmatimonadales bacterium]|jgi:hypothetical protein
MIPDIPWYITAIIVSVNLAIAGWVWRIVATAAGRSGLTAPAARKVRAGSAVFFFGWLGTAFLLAPAPGSIAGRDPFYITPLLPLFALGSTAVLLASVGLSPAVRRTLGAMSLPAVHGVQLYRAIGATFLVLMVQGQLPSHFALPAGWGDVAVGLAAPLVALALARRAAGSRALAAGWNLFGLLDLVVAVGMGTGYLAPLLAPHLGAQVPPAAAMGVFPLILVPTFAVPISIMLHLLGLIRLTAEARIGVQPIPRGMS